MHNIGTPRCPCVSSNCPPLPPAAPAMPAVLQEEPLRAHAVVCTLPLGVLQRGSVAFDPPLPGVHCVLCAVLCAALYMLHAVRCGYSGSLWTAKCVGSAGCPALQSTSKRRSLAWPWAQRTGWPCSLTRQATTQCGALFELSFCATRAVAGGHAVQPGKPLHTVMLSLNCHSVRLVQLRVAMLFDQASCRCAAPVKPPVCAAAAHGHAGLPVSAEQHILICPAFCAPNKANLSAQKCRCSGRRSNTSCAPSRAATPLQTCTRWECLMCSAPGCGQR